MAETGAGQTYYPRSGGYRSVGDQIAHVILDMPTRGRWWIAFWVSGALFLLLAAMLVHLFAYGVGVWGINIPVNWGLAIVNVVWWIGIGHAGTFISAMLLLLGQEWRNSLNRLAETMTIFAVLCAVMFPVIHLGRPANFYWMLPYPTPFEVWPQFRSPLFWDVMAFTTYFTVSVLFWYVGLIPDLASVRDKARRRGWQVAFGIAALGWRGSAAHWVRWRRCYLILAGLAMPLVVSVHSGVALLFAVGQVPGWHTTIFPPYFVLGALFSGFAVVAIIAVVLRGWFRLGNLITDRHLDLLGRFLLATGLATAYGYVFEAFTEWYSGDHFERATLKDRLVGPYAGWYWAAVVFNFAAIQLLWSRRMRSSGTVLLLVSVSVAIGMWLERYVLIVSGLARDFLPSSYDEYHAPWTEWLLFLGTVGLFLFGMVLFMRFVPMIAISEVKESIFHETPPKEPPETAWPASGARPVGFGVDESGVYGLVARFATGADLAAAAERTMAAGYRRVDAHTPFPVDEVNRALGLKETALPWLVAGSGAAALAAGAAILWYVDVRYFPTPIGGRPLAAWPAYALPLFELVVLTAAFAAVLGMLVLNRLPRLHHPVFDTPGFERATQDRFFLAVQAADPLFQAAETRRFLESLGPETVDEVSA